MNREETLQFSIIISKSAGTATLLAWTTQPSLTSPAGVALSTQPVIQVEDQYGNVVSSATNSVSMNLFTGSGCGTAATSPVVNASILAVNGVATLSGYAIEASGTYYYEATASGLTSTACSASPIVIGATYYLSATGSDSNNGLTPSTPWLTPNHVVNCGDVISAAAGTYNSANFNDTFGTVTCPAADNVAWVKCATAFGCEINDTSNGAMFIGNSFWGVQGFVMSTTASNTNCVMIQPNYSTQPEIHHIVLANNVVGPCTADGLDTNDGYSTSPVRGTDYVSYVGNIVYDTGGSSSTCSAGLSFYAPVASDSLSGTHYYMGGNFSWGNTSNCGDGEGVLFDTFDGVEAGWPTAEPYSQQAVAENNLSVYNSGPGIQVDLNDNGSGPWASVYFVNNTSAYNCQGPSTEDMCGEIMLQTTVNTQSTSNLVVAPTQYAFGGSSHTLFGSIAYYAPSATDEIYNEFAYNPFGNGVGSFASTGFVPGPDNTTSTNPSLSNPSAPSTPNCSGYSTTTQCMATVIADFTPTNPAAMAYGYQSPSTTYSSDSLFPSWLCNVNLPSGLVSNHCQ